MNELINWEVATNESEWQGKKLWVLRLAWQPLRSGKGGAPETGSGTYQSRACLSPPGRTAVPPFPRRCVFPAACHRKGWCRPAGVGVGWLEENNNNTTKKQRHRGSLSTITTGVWQRRVRTDGGDLLPDAVDPVATQSLVPAGERDLSAPPAVPSTPLHIGHWQSADAQVDERGKKTWQYLNIIRHKYII